MRRRIRILSLVLAILMLVPAVLAGCSNGSEPDVTEATTPSPVSSDASDPVSDSSGNETTANPNKIDLEGYEFVLNTTAYSGLSAVEEQNGHAGTALFDELMDIYAQIESDLNCVIIAENYDNGTEAMTAAAVGGVKLYDFGCCRQSTWIPLAMMGGIRPLDSMVEAGLDLYNEDVYNQIFTGMSEVEGKLYALDMTGKFDNTRLGHFYAFNKELCENAGYPADTLYQAVRDGEWDYDMFLEIARKVAKDTDGDGVNDIWGVALDTDGNEVWTNGAKMIYYDEAQDKWLANLQDPQLMPALQFMYDLSQNDVQIPVIGNTVGRGDRRTMFYEGGAAFAGLYGSNLDADGCLELAANGKLGCLPLPKGPNADHYVMCMVDLDTFVCPVANQDWEKSVHVMNAIGSAVTDYDAYKAQQLEYLAGDEQALEMLFDYAASNAIMNIAKCSDEMYQITRKKGFFSNIYEMVLTPAQAAETWQSVVQAELDKVFQQ